MRVLERVLSLSIKNALADTLSIPARDHESIYETPYSTHRYNDYGGCRSSNRNLSNDQSRNRQWSYLIIGLVVGLMIGATVTGLSMHFTRSGK